MKKLSRNTLILAIVAAGMMVASLAVAGIENTKHNFTQNAPPDWGSTQLHDDTNAQPQICVYCHTPHNAGQPKFLWNKVSKNTVLTYKFYSSVSTTNAIRTQSAFSADSSSLLCLGCHDGKSAMNVLHNGGKGTAAPAGYPAGSSYAFGTGELFMTNPDPTFFLPNPPSPSLGGGAPGVGTTVDLTDDHPVGFSYTEVYGERATGLRTLADIDTRSLGKIRFFGGAAVQRVECATCHDPHVDYNTDTTLKPFLVMSNSESKLCLSCHDK
ncbi:MAG: hypothetical protein A2076_02905 [Geobacteraceae bacterium GWC2_53_11]|nr:MAG: hypothetical protein A2076_02905 [Geobacteraceae bacterium GWC2_53_11]